jgi:large subunit ribosomal protein L25
MEILSIAAQERNVFGKKANKALRKDGRIPFVIYNKDKVTHGSITPKEVKSLVYTPAFKLVDISVGSTKAKCLLKDITFHPVSDEIEHIDFLELIPGHKLKVEIPVKFEGVSPGVKAGGKLMQSLRKIKVKCTPEVLVDELHVNISHLQLGASVRVKEIKLPEGMELMAAPNTPIAVIEIPRALKSAAAAAAAATDPKKKKK